VIGALAADEACARRIAPHTVIGEGDLERGIDRFRPRVGEERVIEAARGNLHQLVGELEGTGVAHLERRRVVHALELRADRRGDLAPSVPGIHAPQARHGVEDLASVGGPVLHAARAREQPRLRLELPVRGKGHPQRFQVAALERFARGSHRPLGAGDCGGPDDK
jgi:hypothetical protein